MNFIKKNKLALGGILLAIILFTGAFLTKRNISYSISNIESTESIDFDKEVPSFAAVGDLKKASESVKRWIVEVGFEEYPGTWLAKSVDYPFLFYTNHPKKITEELVTKVLIARGVKINSLFKVRHIKSILPAPKGWFKILRLSNVEKRYSGTSDIDK